jgi:sialidase-1
MAEIRYLEGHILYENPKPHVRSRHGYFPGLVNLPSGDLLATLMIAEAFEAADGTTYVARSNDNGRTWALQGPLHERAATAAPMSDCMKATVLADGSLIAMGYRFVRDDPEQSISIAETGGILPGDDIISFSRDEGRTWSVPETIPRNRPELYELSGPAVALRSGDIVAAGALYRMPDGSNPSGQIGVLPRSRDHGRTWDDGAVFFRGPAGNLSPFEPRLCEMQDGRLVALVWAYDQAADRHHANHVTVSHDDGKTWSDPLDTGVIGQASNLTWFGGDRLLTIHAHRGDEIGIFVRVVDFSNDKWRVVTECAIYGAGSDSQTKVGQSAAQMFKSLRFGQPSLLRLGESEFLAAHWCVEEGQGKIRLHRLSVS